MQFLLLPLVCGVIGCFTNYLAIKMLLRPYKEKRVFGVKIPFTPGLIPKRKKEIARQLSILISGSLLTKQMLQDAILKENLDIALNKAMDGFYNETLTTKATEGVGFLKKTLAENEELDEKGRGVVKKIVTDSFGKLAGTMFSTKIYESIKEGLFAYLEDENNIQTLKDEVLSKLSGRDYTFVVEKALDFVLEKIDIQSLVERQINNFSEEMIENMIISVAKRELNYITLMGGVLGFFLGLVIEIILAYN